MVDYVSKLDFTEPLLSKVMVDDMLFNVEYENFSAYQWDRPNRTRNGSAAKP